MRFFFEASSGFNSILLIDFKIEKAAFLFRKSNFEVFYWKDISSNESLNKEKLTGAIATKTLQAGKVILWQFW